MCERLLLDAMPRTYVFSLIRVVEYDCAAREKASDRATHMRHVLQLLCFAAQLARPISIP